MAIQTGGFEIHNLPRYTPSDPTLVALNPNNAVAGAAQGVNLANMVGRAKAEMATRQQRIATENLLNQLQAAKANEAMEIMPQQHELEVQKILAGLKTTAPKANLEAAQAGAGLEALGPQTAKTIAEANAATGTANILNATQGARQQAAVAAAQGAAERAPQEQELAQRKLDLENYQAQAAKVLAPEQAQIEMQDLSDQLTNGSAASWNRKMAQAKIKLDEAQGAKLYGQGAFYLGQGRQTGVRETPAQVVDRLTTAINRLNSQKIDDSGKTLLQYEAETYGPNGKINDKHPYIPGSYPMDTNPAAERILQNRRQLDGALDAAIMHMASGYSPGQDTSTLAGPKIPQDAIDALKANPASADKFDQVFGAGASSQYLPKALSVPPDLADQIND